MLASNLATIAFHVLLLLLLLLNIAIIIVIIIIIIIECCSSVECILHAKCYQLPFYKMSR